MTRLEELKSLLEYHDDLYYNQDSPEISDEEYDELLKEYISLGGEQDYVPGEVSSTLSKIKHPYSVKSLDKIHSEVEVREALLKLAPGVIQPKLDGLTIVVYGQGSAPAIEEPIWSTRGDGEEGENVSNTAKVIPRLHAINGMGYRVEAYMPISKFKEINANRLAQSLPLFKNARNAAAGMLRNSDPTKVQGLTYMAYNIMGSTKKESEQLNLLKQCGLITVPSLPYTKDNIEQAVKFIMEYNDTKRNSLDYEIDGLVIKSDIENSIEKFGSTGHHHNNAVAFKFPSEGKWTKLIKVVWQVGRTGKVTPVAEFEPIDILGSTIKRATLNNYNYISVLSMAENCELYVIKANDVIPRVLKTRNSKGRLIPMAIYCPECGSRLHEQGANMYCYNADCKAKSIARTEHFVRKDALDIPDFSVKTIEKMYDIKLISKPVDIFNLSIEDILKVDGYAKPSATKLFNNIQKSRTAPLNKFLYAAGLPLVGRKASYDIANTLYTFNSIILDIANNNCGEISKIEGIGKEIVNSLKENVKAFIDLSSYVKPIDIEKPTVQKTGPSYTFVITGTLGTARSNVEVCIKREGHKLSGSVSAKTDYVVVGADPGGTKYNKALSLGFDKNGKMITEKEMWAILNG